MTFTQQHPVIPYAAPPLLSPDQLAQISQAQRGAGKIRRAAAVAAFDAWTTAVFAFFTLAGSALSFSLSGLLIGAAMAVAAVQAFRGLRDMRRMEVSAGALLGFNQIFLASALILYAGWSLYHYSTGPAPFAQIIASEPATSDVLVPYQELARTLTLLVYASLIAVAILGQGGAAWYYFSRTGHLRAYRTCTPQWILDLQDAGFRL